MWDSPLWPRCALQRPLTLGRSVEHSTYYDRRLRQSPALIRARRPYLFKNTALGLGIAGFTLGVCEFASPTDERLRRPR